MALEIGLRLAYDDCDGENNLHLTQIDDPHSSRILPTRGKMEQLPVFGGRSQILFPLAVC